MKLSKTEVNGLKSSIGKIKIIHLSKIKKHQGFFLDVFILSICLI